MLHFDHGLKRFKIILCSFIAVKHFNSSTVKYWLISTTRRTVSAKSQKVILIRLQNRLFVRKMWLQTFAIVRELVTSDTKEANTRILFKKTRQSDVWNNLFVSSKKNIFIIPEKSVIDYKRMFLLLLLLLKEVLLSCSVVKTSNNSESNNSKWNISSLCTQPKKGYFNILWTILNQAKQLSRIKNFCLDY